MYDNFIMYSPNNHRVCLYHSTPTQCWLNLYVDYSRLDQFYKPFKLQLFGKNVCLNIIICNFVGRKINKYKFTLLISWIAVARHNSKWVII